MTKWVGANNTEDQLWELTPFKGDVNSDGSITIADAVMLYQYLLTTTSTITFPQAGDLDGNGILADASDAMRWV